jgi:hypothetical protein
LINIPDQTSFTGVADWVGLSISVANNSLSKAAVASALEISGGTEPPETFIASVWRELERRQHLYARSLYCVEDHTVRPATDEQLPEYLTCLLLSLFGVQGEIQPPTKLFERLTCEAVRSYLSGHAVVFGWPFDPEDIDEGQPELQIKQKIRKLAENLCERFIEAPCSPFKKDRGIDVVGWIPIPFRERRSGQVVILLQCAAGHNWKIKRPVPHWGCSPIIAFALPCIISERDWHDTSKDNGILFDRVRIVNLLSEGIQDQTLSQDLSSWVRQQIANLED